MNMPEINIDFEIDIDDGTPKIPEDVEGDAKKQLSEAHQAAKEERHRYEDRMKFEGEFGYYVSVIFKTKEERDAYLATIGHLNIGDKNYVFYDDIKSNL